MRPWAPCSQGLLHCGICQRGLPRITALKDNDTFQRHGIMWVVRVVGMFGKPSASLVLTSTCEG